MIWLALYVAFGAGCALGAIVMYWGILRGDFNE